MTLFILCLLFLGYLRICFLVIKFLEDDLEEKKKLEKEGKITIHRIFD